MFFFVHPLCNIQEWAGYVHEGLWGSATDAERGPQAWKGAHAAEKQK